MKSDQKSKKKEKWAFEIKHFFRIFVDFATNRVKKQHDKSSRQKFVSEQCDYEFEEHEKNIASQFDESIQIRKQIVRECERVNRDKSNDRFWFFMKNTNVLIILRYNVRNENIRTMISLFANKNIQNYDVIAIQKLWRNSFVSISLNNNQNDFHLLYKSKDDIKIYFYVNDQINIDNWKFEYFTIDFSVLKMIVKEVEKNTKIIRIHNVYNSSLVSYTSKNNSFTLSKIMRIIVETFDDHHILLNDFNLHHFF